MSQDDFLKFFKNVLGDEPSEHTLKMIEEITTKVSNDAFMNLMAMPKLNRTRYSTKSINIETIKKLKEQIEAPQGSFLSKSAYGDEVEVGLKKLKANMVIIDDPLGRETEEGFFKAHYLRQLSQKIVTSTAIVDYENVPMTWKERFFSFKWFTKYKKVFKPKIIVHQETGTMYCSPAVADEIKNNL
jgi:hypothetical protein